MTLVAGMAHGNQAIVVWVSRIIGPDIAAA